MKKFFSLLVLLVVSFMFVGCGPKEKEVVDDVLYPEDRAWTMLEAKHESPIEITMWIPNSATSSMGAAIGELANLYNSYQAVTYPGKNISVVVEYQGTSGALNTKLQACNSCK